MREVQNNIKNVEREYIEFTVYRHEHYIVGLATRWLFYININEINVQIFQMRRFLLSAKSKNYTFIEKALLSTGYS